MKKGFKVKRLKLKVFVFIFLLFTLITEATPGHPKKSQDFLGTPEIGSFATYRWTPAIEEKTSVVYKTISPEGSVSYKVVTEPVKAIRPFYITYSVIKKEGDRYYWVQITTREVIDSEPLVITKIKIDRKKEKIVKALVKSTKSIYRKVSPFDEIVPVRLKALRDAKQEEITVLGKSYMSTHGVYNNMEVWVSGDIPVTGIIKAVMADGVLELVPD